MGNRICRCCIESDQVEQSNDLPNFNPRLSTGLDKQQANVPQQQKIICKQESNHGPDSSRAIKKQSMSNINKPQINSSSNSKLLNNISSSKACNSSPNMSIIRPGSKDYQQILNNQEQVQILIDKGQQALKLQHYNQASQIFCKAVSILKDSRRNGKYQPATIQGALIHIHQSLIEIQIARKDFQKAKKYFIKCIELHNAQEQNLIVQQKIAIFNNYSVFLRSIGQSAEAINYCRKALQLERKYYTVQDIRKYHTLINLAVLLQQNNNNQEANLIYQQISKCRDPEIRKQALSNQEYINSSRFRN